MNEYDIFAAALEIPNAEDRKSYLDSACRDDEALRERIETLLRSHDAAGGLLESPAFEGLATQIVSASEADFENCDAATGSVALEVPLDFLSESEYPDALGRLGQYEILEVVGRGGMGIVLRGFDPNLNRVVAIKVLSPDYAANPTAYKRFLREARAAAAVSHDHIVTIYAVEERPVPHLVMEYIDGMSLQQKIETEGQLEIKEILRIARQIAGGLAAAHEQGLTHRDIKPSNILLQNGIQRVQITDFGLARAAADADITRPGEIPGTPQYMSPEQAQGQPVDPRSDLFSLGSVMYAMCSGHSPFRADTSYGSIKRVCDDEPRSLRENNPEIPTWLEAIIFKLLAKNPADRFQSAAEVHELLGRHLSHLHDPGATAFPGTLQYQPARRKRFMPHSVTAAAVMLMAVLALGFTEAAGVTHVAGTVIRLATGEGTLVIEVDDPSVEVSLDGEELTITGAGMQEIKLRPGEYQFKATKNGKPVEQKLVSIRRGDREVVRVTREDLGAAPNVAVNSPSVSNSPIKQVSFIELNPRYSFVDALAFSKEGSEVICGRGVYLIEVWNLKSGKSTELRGPDIGAGIDLSLAAGRMVNWHNELDRISLIDLTNLQTIRTLAPQDAPPYDPTKKPKKREGGGYVDVAISPNGKLVAAASYEHGVRVWNADTGEVVHQLHDKSLATLVEFSPDSQTLLIGVERPKQFVQLVDVESGNDVWKIDGGYYRSVAAFSPAGDAVVISQGRALVLRDAASGEEKHRFWGHEQQIGGVEFLPDGRHFVSGCRDQTLRLWNVETGREVAHVTTTDHSTTRIAVSPDGRTVASAGGSYRDRKNLERDPAPVLRIWRLPESVQP